MSDRVGVYAAGVGLQCSANVAYKDNKVLILHDGYKVKLAIFRAL